MKKYGRIFLLLLVMLPARASAQDLPVDKNATRETVNLYRNLKKTLSKGILFGHQDDLAYGFGWR